MLDFTIGLLRMLLLEEQSWECREHYRRSEPVAGLLSLEGEGMAVKTIDHILPSLSWCQRMKQAWSSARGLTAG